MRRSGFRLLCAAAVVLVMACGAYALATGDSLISLSYLKETFLPEAVEKAMDQRTTLGVFDGKMAEYAQYESVQAMRDAARNPGAGGAFASMGMGLGIGARMAGQLGDGLDAAGKSAASSKVKCAKCGSDMDAAAKFCPNCGAKAVPAGSITCPKCGKAVPAKSRFCPECGANLAVKCPKCGIDVKPGAKFCPNCGEKLF